MKGIRLIKNKIKATQNLAKIAQAMAMVSVNKMRKAQKYALASRPIVKAILSLLAGARLYHFLTKENKKAKKDLVIIIAADRGLAGSLNLNVFKTATNFLNSNPSVDLILIGKKTVQYFTRPQWQKFKIIASFTKYGDYFKIEDTLELSDFLINAYQQKIYRQVFVIYTHFLSTLKQKVLVRRILPLSLNDLYEVFGNENQSFTDYLIEPKKEIFQQKVVPMIFRILVHHLILEANASEHSARMVAMKKAQDNANEMLTKLYLLYNKARQENITNEILDITRSTF